MFSNPVDSRQLIHLPLWMKYLVVLLLAASFGISGYLAFSYLGHPENSDIIILAMSGVQFAATALAAVILLLFSQTESTIDALEDRSEMFLEVQLPRFLGRITLPGLQAAGLSVATSDRTDLFGRIYTLSDAGQPVARLWCGINVRRMILIYYFQCPGADNANATAARVADLFQYTLKGAERLGYEHVIEPLEAAPGSVSLWLTVMLGDGFLTDPAQKFFWAQDVAMMTQSLLRTAARSDGLVRIDPERQPEPL